MTNEKTDTTPHPETFVRFTGMKAAGEFPEIPRLGDRWKFEVTAECVKEPHRELMADGHLRPVVGMKVLEVEPGKIEPGPEKDPQLPFEPDGDEL